MKNHAFLLPAFLLTGLFSSAPAVLPETVQAAPVQQQASSAVAAPAGHFYLSSVDAIDQQIAAVKKEQKDPSLKGNTQAVQEKLAYLRKAKELVFASKDRQDFIRNMEAAYPSYGEKTQLKKSALSLFPDKKPLPIANTGSAQDIASIKSIIQRYADSITHYNLKEAEQIWQTDDRTTYVHPRGNEYGWKAIRDHFYGVTMHDHFVKRQLFVHDINIQVYGDMAVSVFYWDFPAVFRSDGTEVTTHGRETQVYNRTPEGWKIVHVHYSQMPVTGAKKGF